MWSQRLKKIASYVPAQAVLADIGCDHAWLPVALLAKGHISSAIACDLRPGPLEGAAKNAIAAGLSDEQLSLRLGNGLSPLAPGEADVVVMAGMGGALMVSLLEAEPLVVADLKRLVLSPNRAPWLVRQWTVDAGWQIIDEGTVYEQGHGYEIIVCEPTSQGVALTDVACYFGPVLLKRFDDDTVLHFFRKQIKDALLLDTWTRHEVAQEKMSFPYNRLKGLWKEWEEERWNAWFEQSLMS